MFSRRTRSIRVAAVMASGGVALVTLAVGCNPNKPPAETGLPVIRPQPIVVAPLPGPTTAPAPEEVIATVGADAITLGQLEKPLIESYGLNILLNLVQLDLAKRDAAKAGVTVSPVDLQQEYDSTLAKMFKDADKGDYETLLDQFLTKQRMSRPEFMIVLEINANLRKVAQPQLKDKLTDDVLHEQFNVLYGETVQVRHIQMSSRQGLADAQRRLAAGEPFDHVARELSENARTRDLGGELPTFSRASTGIPQAFKDVAFSLQPGQISDPVSDGGNWHLIQMERRFPPKAVKFEDVKESLRQKLQSDQEDAAINDFRQILAGQARAQLKIVDPTLALQFEQRQTQQRQTLKDRQAIRDQLEKEHLTTTQATQPATQNAAQNPAQNPAQSPLTQPVSTMPATMPGGASVVSPPGPTSSPVAAPR